MRKRLNNIWNKEKTIDVPDCNLKFFKLFLSLSFYRVYLWFFVNLMDDAQGWFSLKHRQGLLPIICQFNNGPDWMLQLGGQDTLREIRVFFCRKLGINCLDLDSQHAFNTGLGSYCKPATHSRRPGGENLWPVSAR